MLFFFSSRRRHTRLQGDWSSDVCSSDLDAGADEIMSYGGVTESDIRDLIYGCLFTRGPKDLKNTAVWIGGTNMTAGEQLLAMAVDAMFGPFRVSLMLDSNGSNTTAVAAVVKIEQALGSP